MQTLISNLPKKIRELALKRQREDMTDYYNKETDSLMWAFNWSLTKEGGQYWDSIDDNYSGQPLKEDNLKKVLFKIERIYGKVHKGEISLSKARELTKELIIKL